MINTYVDMPISTTEKATYTKDLSLSCAKGIGIILMVMGHASCPEMLRHFIYSFHMPLFFIISGYLLSNYISKDIKTLFNKRIHSLYIPYLKWSILFIIFHNLFLNLNLIDGEHLTFIDILKKVAWSALFMRNTEILTSGYWFIQALFIGSIGTIFLLRIVKSEKIGILIMLLLSMLALWLESSFKTPQVISNVCLAMMFVMAGIFIRKYKSVLKKPILIFPTFVIVLIGSIYCFASFDYCLYWRTLPFLLIGTAGSIMVLNICHLIKPSFQRVLCFIGDNSFIILTLHLLSFRIVNFILIKIHNLSIDSLTTHPTITSYDHMWIAYTIVGVITPLLVQKCYNYATIIMTKKN